MNRALCFPGARCSERDACIFKEVSKLPSRVETDIGIYLRKSEVKLSWKLTVSVQVQRSRSRLTRRRFFWWRRFRYLLNFECGLYLYFTQETSKLATALHKTRCILACYELRMVYPFVFEKKIRYEQFKVHYNWNFIFSQQADKRCLY